MSHRSRKCNKHRECDKPVKFHDTVGKGKLNSTPIIVPPSSDTEVGTELHPGPFVAQAFDPKGQRFFGLLPRRNTPDKSPEKGGKILMDEICRHGNEFYEPRVKHIHRNFAKKAEKKSRHH